MPDGRFFLYFKSRPKSRGSKIGLAIADQLEGPYEIQKDPVTDNKVSVEDGYVFLGADKKVHLITTERWFEVQKSYQSVSSTRPLHQERGLPKRDPGIRATRLEVRTAAISDRRWKA